MKSQLAAALGLRYAPPVRLSPVIPMIRKQDIGLNTVVSGLPGGTMHKALLKIFGLFVAIAVFILSGCGGGGGGQSGGIPLVDPVPSYSGVTTQAAVTSANAENLALGVYGGGGIAQGILAKKGASSIADYKVPDPKVRQFTMLLKKAMVRMELPKIANQHLRVAPPNRLEKVVRKLETYTTTGPKGGTATFSVDINESSRSINGSVTFNNYASDGITVSGSADMYGTFSSGSGNLVQLTISFSRLTLQADVEYTLIGYLSAGFNLPSSESISMNMVMKGASGKTYWFKDYRIDNLYGNDSQATQTLSGRYYDSSEGYIDITTPAPTVLRSTAPWPVQGTVNLSGKSGTWVRLSFVHRSLKLEADTDGTGGVDWSVEHSTNTQAQANDAPLAAAGADRTVLQTTLVTLDGSGSTDPEGDTFSYYWTFQSCPDNSCPTLASPATATPSFVADGIGNYVLGLSLYDGVTMSAVDTVTITSSEVSPTEPSLLKKKWQYWKLGDYIGEAGVITADIDGDGEPEIISSGRDSYLPEKCFWYVLKKGSDGGYRQVWRSDNYLSYLNNLIVTDFDGDGRKDIVVGFWDGRVEVFDGVTFTRTAVIAASSHIEAMAVADVDNDGQKELVTSDGTGLFVYSSTGVLKWSLPNVGGVSLAIGNVDADTDVEIVATTYGGKGYVVDGYTHEVKWEYANGFGTRIALGDVNGDGKTEIVGAGHWNSITVFSAYSKGVVSSITTNQAIEGLLVTDVNGDGVCEVVYGDDQWGKIHAVNARTGSDVWSINNPDWGVYNLGIGDVDGDGNLEAIWAARQGRLLVGDPLTGTIKWKDDWLGPFSVVAVGDVDNDGEDEIVAASFGVASNGFDGEAYLYIFDGKTHILKYRRDLGVAERAGINSIWIGDLDGDGRTEYVITLSAGIYAGNIAVYDGATGVLKGKTTVSQGVYYSAIAIADLDNDGRKEIICGEKPAYSGKATHIVVYDGSSLLEKWRSGEIYNDGPPIYDIAVADVDDDGHLEIIASASSEYFNGGRLAVLDGMTHQQKLLLDYPARAVAVGDIDGDRRNEILVGRNDGKIDVLDGRNFSVKKTVLTYNPTPVDALRVVDSTGTGSGDWIVAGGGIMTVLGGHGEVVKWRAKNLSGNLGRYNHIGVKDADHDGRREFVIGSDLCLYDFQ
jgi:hypothetical protein